MDHFLLKAVFRHVLSCDRASVDYRLYKIHVGIGQGLAVYSELQCLCVGALLRQSAAGMIMQHRSRSVFKGNPVACGRVCVGGKSQPLPPWKPLKTSSVMFVYPKKKGSK